MQLRKVTAGSKELPELVRLYESAFPANERWGLNAVLEDKTGISELLSFFEGETFCGFSIMLHYGSLSHIIYFAVDGNLRSRGCGTEMLRLIREHLPEQVIMVDIEREYRGRITTNSAAAARHSMRAADTKKQGCSTTGAASATRS